MSRAAPRRSLTGYDVIRGADRFGHAKLVFDTSFYGDELKPSSLHVPHSPFGLKDSLLASRRTQTEFLAH